MTLYITNVPIRCTINAAIHATTHCPSTTYAAHFAPSSLLIDAIAATHGVYNRQKTKRLAAATGVIAPVSSAVLPKSTESVDTTLSFAINPVISAVEIFQFPKPSGRNTGAMIPATTARILSLESATTFMCKLNVCRNQMIIVAKKITVNALCKKSFAFPTEAALHSLLPAYGNSEVP